MHYKVDSGTIGVNPYQSPRDGDSVEVYLANEADARTEAWWRPSCESGATVRIWWEGRQEVWGRTYPGKKWYLVMNVAPMAQGEPCVQQGSVKITDASGNELPVLLESTSVDPHVFYVRMDTPLIPGSTVKYTQAMEGKLISYNTGGTTLAEVPYTLEYGGTWGDFHRAGPFEAVYVNEGDTLSVPTATRINAVRYAPIVADPQKVASNAVNTFVTVVVNSITFNWEAGHLEDAMTVLVYKDTPATLPEWPIPSNQIYKGASQAAYYGGTKPIIRASISVIPPDKTVDIQPVSQKCGGGYFEIMPTCFPAFLPQTITGSEQVVDFTFGDTLSNQILYMHDKLYWDVNVPGNYPVQADFTGPHEMYVIDRPPVDSMEQPWEEVLRFSTYSVSSNSYIGISDQDILAILGESLFSSAWHKERRSFANSMFEYDSDHKWRYIVYYPWPLNGNYLRLNNVLTDLNSPGTVHVDCFTVASFYKVLANSLGIDLHLLQLSPKANTLDTNYIWPIGILGDPVAISWEYHLTAYNISPIYEATFKLDFGGPLPLWNILPGDYIQQSFLTPIENIDQTPQSMSISPF